MAHQVARDVRRLLLPAQTRPWAHFCVDSGVDHQLAIDNNMLDAGRVLVRLFIGRLVRDSVRVGTTTR